MPFAVLGLKVGWSTEATVEPQAVAGREPPVVAEQGQLQHACGLVVRRRAEAVAAARDEQRLAVGRHVPDARVQRRARASERVRHTVTSPRPTYVAALHSGADWTV